MANRLQLRRDTAATWTLVDPVLAQGEPGWEIDTNKVKYGDGVTAWTSLQYSNQVVGAFDTDDIVEAGNLYWTTARGNAMVAAYQGDVSTAGNIAASYLSGDGTGITNVLTNYTTTDLAEGTNEYFTIARANSAFDAKLVTSDTDGLAEGATNLYYTETRGNVNFDARIATSSTSDLSEGTNLYWTDARGNTNFTTNLTASSTTDLSEGTNLYYTSARTLASIYSGYTVLKNFNESQETVTGLTPALTTANGTIKSWTLTGSSTPTISLIAGASLTLIITAGVNAITWPTMTWLTSDANPPVLESSGTTTIVVWFHNAVYYGIKVGPA